MDLRFLSPTINGRAIVPVNPKRRALLLNTARYLEKWRHASDKDRSAMRAAAIGRMIALWDRVRRCRRWTDIAVIVPGIDSHDAEINSERRWVRRNLYTFSKAGLVEVRQQLVQRHPDAPPVRVTFFRATRRDK